MEYPKLRNLEAFPVKDNDQEYICVRDPRNFTDKTIFISPPTFFIISLFDGTHSVVDIQSEFMKRYGEMVFGEKISEIIEKVDENLMLDNDRFREHMARFEKEFLDSPVRKSMMEARGMKPDPEAASKEIQGYFLAMEGPGLPDGAGKKKDLLGAVLPHIDYRRGGNCYAWGYKEIVERSEADLYIILGTNHMGVNGMFTLTQKSFSTPFGLVNSDTDFIKSLEDRVSWDLRAGELDHKNEHSIELQATFLHSLYHDKKPFTIVPILCGGISPSHGPGGSPFNVKKVREFIEALGETIRECDKKSLALASADLSHMGPQFGDRDLMNDEKLRDLEKRDLETLGFLERLDGEGFYEDVMKDGNLRKICGLSNIYTLMKIIEPREGKLVRYGQWPDEQGTVSFASVVFSS